MRKRRQIELFSISFLDLLSGALGAVIILYVAIPKNKAPVEVKDNMVIESLQQSLKDSQLELAAIKAKMEEVSLRPSPIEEKKSGSSENYDVGFKFAGKSILFIIDTSYSMTEEDRMGQVKAGLKMLITSMSAQFKVDVIQFPFGERAPFKVMWGDVKDNSGQNQSELFEHMYALRPHGGTPARDVLLFALKNYDTISDIVFLSDGAPTFHNSNKKDDIYDILQAVRELNHRKVQISAIGVGSGFRDKESDQYKFMTQLATEHHGFFVGF